ncbi:hypothetical protein K435DRAFT_751156 [Dendrothele bispora CBS 962.96]|uniref:Concanavalin A-like lectin/glucanase n=1 Tax=Dendrothele bispora (strain CBS 962.96) TaxID=1314807 RepID=A0A4S8MD96_DENBC|nr:hypothetical protein K435DRAFT_751156 [Dendrothele bispora CBS 962.96]
MQLLLRMQVPRAVFNLTLTLVIVLTFQLANADFFGTDFFQPTGVRITRTTVTMKVPAVPARNLDDQTLFIWPGIQPGNGLNEPDGDPAGIGNGVLQPVLTWGPSCAPGDQPTHQWWISAQYVNTNTNLTGFAGCFGGETMPLLPDDLVECTIQLVSGSVATWDQVCTNLRNQDSVSFTFDLAGQKQSWAELKVETTSSLSLNDWDFPVFFYNLEITTDGPMSECVIPASGVGFRSRASALGADAKTCTLGGIGYFNTRLAVFNLTLTLVIVLTFQLANADFFGTDFFQPTGVRITRTTVTMKVPAVPARNLDDQTLFIWPGIQPGNGLNEPDGDPAGIGNGVLQPVLTWGPSCAPGDQPTHQWWISAQYVNTNTNLTGFAGCFGGETMPLLPDDLVECTIQLVSGSVATWDQVCTNLRNQDSVSFTFDLAGQKQSWAELKVETTSSLSFE